jgi:putative ABC transport system ATP-binding protein
MLIDIQDVRRVYPMGETEVTALQGVSVQIDAGEFVTIMGPSGSGKSTLMHLLGCLDRPSSGRYLLDGTAVESMDDLQLSRLRNRKVGFVFQSFNLIPQLTVVENVELPLVYSSVPREQRRSRAAEVLGAVGLAARAEHRPTELSGGECQRVAIARALVNAPPLILADEPTGNLDSKTGLEILKIFKRLHEQGTTLILVTHDAEVAKWSERVVRMRDGKIELDSGRSVARAAAAGPAAAPGGWREVQ